MLAQIEMHTIDFTRSHNTTRVKVIAVEIRSNLLVRLGQADASLFCVIKFRRNRSPRILNRRRTHDQDRRRWHSWPDPRLSDLVHKLSVPPRRRTIVFIWLTEM